MKSVEISVRSAGLRVLAGDDALLMNYHFGRQYSL